MDGDRFSISPQTLYGRFGAPSAGLIVDVRREASFATAQQMIAGAIRRAPDSIDQWSGEIGHGHPGPKIDRIACPWLIRRFVDPEAKFLYVPTERVFDVARESRATAYDIPGAEPFTHDGEKCSFDALLKVYGIRDPALDTLALIVRGADTDRLTLAPQSSGLLAVTLGLSANFPDDHAMLEQGMAVYDALYAWCRSLQGERHGWNPDLGR